MSLRRKLVDKLTNSKYIQMFALIGFGFVLSTAVWHFVYDSSNEVLISEQVMHPSKSINGSILQHKLQERSNRIMAGNSLLTSKMPPSNMLAMSRVLKRTVVDDSLPLGSSGELSVQESFPAVEGPFKDMPSKASEDILSPGLPQRDLVPSMPNEVTMPSGQKYVRVPCEIRDATKEGAIGISSSKQSKSKWKNFCLKPKES